EPPSLDELRRRVRQRRRARNTVRSLVGVGLVAAGVAGVLVVARSGPSPQRPLDVVGKPAPREALPPPSTSPLPPPPAGPQVALTYVRRDVGVIATAAATFGPSEGTSRPHL